MPSKFDFLIIETYAELALVAASLFTVLSAAVFWLWRRRTRSLKRKAEIPRPFVPRRHISPLEREFDKIATVISGASDRANH